MKKNRLYITDLDGTLLQDDATLSPFCRKTLQEMMSQGLQFTVASARSVFSMQDILKGLTFDLPIVSINGGYISDLSTGRHHFINEIDTIVVESLLRIIDEGGCEPWVSTFDGTKDRLYYSRMINEGMQWYLADRIEAKDVRLHHLDELSVSLQDQVICLIVMGKEKQLAALRATIEEQHGGQLMMQFYENRYSPGWYWLSIHDQKATKGRALRTLVDRWELKDTELVVFGDAENDIEMFQEADRAVAVSNAEATLKPFATDIIGPNVDDSVVKFIAAEMGILSRTYPN